MLSSSFWPTQESTSFADLVVAKLPAGPIRDGQLNLVAEPRTIGSADAGRRMVAGRIKVFADEASIPHGGIWELKGGSRRIQSWLHGFTWLDDLAAVRDAQAITLARNAAFEWINRFGDGKGPGWVADIAGRRLIRLIGHAPLLLALQPEQKHRELTAAVVTNASFIGRRWRSLPNGLRRLEALTGLVYGYSALQGRESSLRRTAGDMARDANSFIDSDGGILSRNPEDLLKAATLLGWASAVLSDAGMPPVARHIDAIRRSARVLRAVRHADGSLARFHGGGCAPEGYLDRVLAESGNRLLEAGKPEMGYVKLAARGASAIIDAAAPHSGAGSENSHASTLAFEFCSDGGPVVVNRGSGTGFAGSARSGLRETRSSSTIEIDGRSSSRIAPAAGAEDGRSGPVLAVPGDVRVEQLPGPEGKTVIASHDGYAPMFGVTHMRRLDLSDGAERLWGEDTLWTRSNEHRATYAQTMERRQHSGLGIAARFHIHPGVSVEKGQDCAVLELGNGDIWEFRNESGSRLYIESSDYMDETRSAARGSSQLVLESELESGADQLRWSFTKAEQGARRSGKAASGRTRGGRKGGAGRSANATARGRRQSGPAGGEAQPGGAK